MADDLSQFFAKKAAKTKDKRKKVKVNLDEVGEVLERKSKRQEERDRLNEDAEKASQEEANTERRTEDSEWLEYKDSNREISLEEIGIRDMNLTEQKKEGNDELIVPQLQPPKQKYVVRAKQQAALKKGGVVPNLDDHDMFPTFADAEKMEKNNKDAERKKRNDGFTVVMSDRERGLGLTGNVGIRRSVASSSGDRGAALAAVRQMTASAGGASNPVPPKLTTQSGKPKYVPPPLRCQK
uniref:Protein CDV3 homolog n=1 Tax=Syphacia muris TaxID=451379 RepID=A0A0N5A9T4_9BILA